ncbi:MAG: transporter related-protein, partial [Pedosphaera sp.]|nr:transporter related-protein [Pedosphaera sp.]
MNADSAPPIPAVQTTGLTRTYGAMTALSSLDLTVNRGDLFGFIGSNGAGKTTTLRILATFLAPSAGSARVLGHDVVRDADAVRHVIGYMPDFFGVYKDMEVTEYLDFFGACYKIPTAQREKTVNDVLELVGLTEKKGALIGALSRGMQQRLGLARVLIHDPQLLLLDEPASGLDPRARIEMMAILQELQRLGKTIIISSHILSELQTLCNRVAIIEKGKLIYSGPVQGVRDQMSSGLVVWVKVATDTDRAIELLKTRTEVAEVLAVDGRIKVTMVNHDIDHSCVADTIVR